MKNVLQRLSNDVEDALFSVNGGPTPERVYATNGKEDVRELRQILTSVVNKASKGDRRVIIVIDALNMLEKAGKTMKVGQEEEPLSAGLKFVGQIERDIALKCASLKQYISSTITSSPAFSWRQAEYTVWNVETKLALFRANTPSKEFLHMVVPASLLFKFIVTLEWETVGNLFENPSRNMPRSWWNHWSDRRGRKCCCLKWCRGCFLKFWNSQGWDLSSSSFLQFRLFEVSDLGKLTF